MFLSRKIVFLDRCLHLTQSTCNTPLRFWIELKNTSVKERTVLLLILIQIHCTRKENLPSRVIRLGKSTYYQLVQVVLLSLQVRSKRWIFQIMAGAIAAYREWFFREWFFHSTLALLRWKSCRRRRSLSRWSAPCKFRRNCSDVYTHLLSSKAFSYFAFTKMQWANICNFRQSEFRSNVSSNLMQQLSSKVCIFRKIEEADSLSVGVYGSSLVAKRNTAINIWTRTHPQWN